jgi:polyhydroxyalkanoate synthesis regulator phasin
LLGTAELAAQIGDVVTLTEIAALKANVRHLEEELEALKRTVANLRSELGSS